MNQESFDQVGRQAAVCEPENAGEDPPETLTTEESALYRHLLSLEKGRLEQEFLPERWVHCGLKAWHEDKEWQIANTVVHRLSPSSSRYWISSKSFKVYSAIY